MIFTLPICWSPFLELSLAEQWVLKTDLTPAQPTHLLLLLASSLSLTKCTTVLTLTTGHLVTSNSKHVKIYFISVSLCKPS